MVMENIFETFVQEMIIDNVLYDGYWSQGFKDRWIEEIMLNIKGQFPELIK